VSYGRRLGAHRNRGRLRGLDHPSIWQARASPGEALPANEQRPEALTRLGPFFSQRQPTLNTSASCPTHGSSAAVDISLIDTAGARVGSATCPAWPASYRRTGACGEYTVTHHPTFEPDAAASQTGRRADKPAQPCCRLYVPRPLLRLRGHNRVKPPLQPIPEQIPLQIALARCNLSLIQASFGSSMGHIGSGCE